MEILPIAHFRSPLTTKFGLPRQSGIATNLKGRIVMARAYSAPDYIRGLEDFSHLWIIWGFSAHVCAEKHATVRPPRMGGNVRMGVFATRSPFRPNNLGLSSVCITGITTLHAHDDEGEYTATAIEVKGADLMDGTPVYDIKPYLPFCDSHPEASGGFTSSHSWQELKAVIPDSIDCLSQADKTAISQILSQDPRPHYHDDPQRVYGMPYGPWDVKFRVEQGQAIVTEINKNTTFGEKQNK